MRNLVLSLAAFAAVILGISLAPHQASAITPECNASSARATITTSVPYGGSASVNDLYTVKVINTGAACLNGTVVITPRVGYGFGSIVSTNGGWTCTALPVGDLGPTTCATPIVAGSSISTIRVQYNKVAPSSGAPSVTFSP